MSIFYVASYDSKPYASVHINDSKVADLEHDNNGHTYTINLQGYTNVKRDIAIKLVCIDMCLEISRIEFEILDENFY